MISDPPGERVTTPPSRRYSPRETRQAMRHVTLAWVFGAPFFSIVSGAAFTSFLTRYLKAGDVVYGLIMAAGPAALVFLFVGAYNVERTGRARLNLLYYCTAHRALWILLAAMPLLMTRWSLGARLSLVAGVAFIGQALSNYGNAGWYAWVSDIVPHRVAGRYFATRVQLGLISMAIVSTAVIYVLQREEGKPWIYTLVFGVAVLTGCTDLFVHSRVPEAPRPVEAVLPDMRAVLLTPWRSPDFRGLARYTALSTVAYAMMAPFTWRYCFDPVSAHGLGMGVLQAHLLLYLLPSAAMAWASPMWGRAIDRFGPRPALAASALAAIVVPSTWVWVHHDILWVVWVTGLLTGLTWPGIDQVSFYVCMKCFPEARRTTFIATYQMVLGLATVAGTAIGGECAACSAALLRGALWAPAWMSHYQPLFLASILLRLVVFALLFRTLALPGDASAAAVARDIARDVRRTLPSKPRRAPRRPD